MPHLHEFAKKRSTAVMLGAGASAAFGYPTTKELLSRIAAEIDGSLFGAGDKDKSDAQKLDRALTVLQPGWKNGQLDQPLITDILSLLDHAQGAGHVVIPGLRPDECGEVRALLERALVEVIDDVFRQGSFSDLCHTFVNWTMSAASGVISTNYDVEYDIALFRRVGKPRVRSEFDFGFSWRDTAGNKTHERPISPTFRLYKLHGSLNWLRCPVCEHTYINLDGSIRELAYATRRSYATTCDCGQYPLSPVAVSPSYVRDIRNADLLYLWKNALEMLRLSDHLVIAGYSLPAEDIAIRSLLHRAYRAELLSGRKPTVHVVLREASRDVQGRYKAIFPEATIFDHGIESYLRQIWQDPQKE